MAAWREHHENRHGTVARPAMDNREPRSRRSRKRTEPREIRVSQTRAIML